LSDLRWLIAREIPHLRRYARALTRDQDDADDVVQETLLKALRKSGQWRRSGSVRAWLFTTLYRTYLNGLRDRKAARSSAISAAEQAALGAGTPSERPAQEASLVWRDVGEALDRLPEDQRVALLLVTLEDLSYDEAATVLDVPIGTLRSRVSRAREALRRTMDPALEPKSPIRRIK
jgi:RNA polymerase sigma-70 factor (ECF subfamily)